MVGFVFVVVIFLNGEGSGYGNYVLRLMNKFVVGEILLFYVELVGYVFVVIGLEVVYWLIVDYKFLNILG